MADRIVVMREGRILQVGTPTEIYQHPADIFTRAVHRQPIDERFGGDLFGRAPGVCGFKRRRPR